MEIESAPALLYQEETGTSFYDGLTGLFNHGFFQLMLEREIKRSERQGRPVSLALIDIGGFNRYNLQHGYPAGDHLLIELAKLLLENIRTIDLAARFAGDLFALLLVDTQVEQAHWAVERIQSVVRERFPDSLHLFIGLTSFPKNALNHLDLLQQALEAVKKAKLMGGEGIYSFEPSHPGQDPEKSSILLVDDDPRNLKLLEAFGGLSEISVEERSFL
jgi:diguanylate cyclase (GGDEF)-like protein